MRQEAARAFVDGLTALDRNQLMGVGLDPGGSRVLEAALQGPAAGPKARKKLLRQLQGGWALLAVQPGGSHVVEAAYIIAVRISAAIDLDIWAAPPQLTKLYSPVIKGIKGSQLFFSRCTLALLAKIIQSDQRPSTISLELHVRASKVLVWLSFIASTLITCQLYKFQSHL